MDRARVSLRAHGRGYVLFVVLVVGIVASLAALSLTTMRGGGEVASIHSELGDRSRFIAEAGIQRAMFYLNDISNAGADFDAALDPDLDSDCSDDPATDDLRPDTSTDADEAVEWTGGTHEVIGGKHYTCVSFGGGRYCVHFEDDDDDGVETDLWQASTGNNEATGGTCDSSGCLEGPAGVDTTCGNHNSGEHNPLRDRNRSIWVVAIGIYPDVDYDQASHKTTLRRFHSAPLPVTNAGLSIKGNLDTKNWHACSDIAGIEVAGDVELNGSGCTSGWSTANSWSGEAKCTDTGACLSVPFDGGLSITAVDGGHRMPGPSLPDMPDPWDNANEWIDFGRECVFWLDWGDGTGDNHSLANINGTIDAHQIWWWDADEDRGPGGLPCSDFETTAAPDARMPGPPNPGRSGDASGDASDPADWAGCWSPLLLDMNATTDSWPYGLVSAVVGIGTSSAGWSYTDDEFDCWTPPFRNPSLPIPIPPERTTGTGTCEWQPNQSAGVYDVCNPASLSDCTAFGNIVGSLINAPGDPVNARLANEGFPNAMLFPPGARLSKPNWATACTVEYPPPNTVIGGSPVTTQNWGCTTCDGTNGVIRSVGNGPWFKFPDAADVTAVPAGVYFITGSPGALTGASWDWSFNATDGPTDPAVPWQALNEWPLATIMVDRSLRLQRKGFTWGIGQAHPGDGNGGRESRWARSASWIVGGLLELQGGGESAAAGSVYAGTGASWTGNGDFTCFGQLYSDGDFTIGSNATTFYWLYQVDLGSTIPPASSGVLPTQSFIAQ